MLTRTTALHVLSLVAARLLVTALAWAFGFGAISDDDFARVTISQAFASLPRVDPTGTSWLPFPFWVTGAAMAVLGTSLAVAKVVAMSLACASGIVLYAAARSGGVSAGSAWLGALLWTFVPVGVFTGAATVPELPTAALCSAALLLLRRDDAKAAWVAAAIVLPATLSRYEAWPVAACVVAGVAVAGVKDGTRAGLASRAGAIALACLGPIAWVLWNRHAHGDAFHFHARVSAYWFAWGGATKGWVGPLEPLLVDGVLLGVSAAGALYWGRGAPRWRAWSVPLLACAGVVVALALAQITGGAPTHHPERTLLFVWGVGWVAVADLWPVPAGAQRGWKLWRGVWGGAVIAVMVTRTHATAPSYGVNRSDELRVGTWLRDHAEGPVLLAPKDYGYFAILAAMGSRDRVTLASSVDPRDRPTPCPFEEEGALRTRALTEHARWLVASGQKGRVARGVGDPRFETGAWVVVEAPSR
jgi:hypothetical protein